MPTPIIRLGDPSDHGGVMAAASGFPTIDGIPMCVDGDPHVCPQYGHGTTPVTSVSILTTIDGRRVLIQGSVAGCGARPIPTQYWVVSD